MKRITAIFTAVVMILSVFNAGFAKESFYIDLEGEWQVDFYDEVNAKGPSKSGTVKVPGALEMQGYGYPGYYYEEQVFWGMPEDDGVRTKAVYTYKFISNDEGKAYLVFDNVKDVLDLTFNGKKYKTSFNAEIGTIFEIDLIRGENTIEAAVTRDGGGINKADNFALSGIIGKVYITDMPPYGKAVSKEVSLKDGLINIDGKPIVIYAVRYTPTAPATGDAIEEAQMDEDIALIKEYGFNTVLTSAAPDYFYRKAKEAGLYIIDEANVYLGNADRDRDAAKGRIEEMVKRHRQYDNIILWSLGSGTGNIDKSLKSAVSALDKRPLLQDMNISEFEVFGATGGMTDWYNTLGKGNIGGVIKEFADKELYAQRRVYDFETKDKITGDIYAASGEIRSYLGEDMLGEGEFEINLKPNAEYTIETYISSPDGNRVLFESGDVKLSVRDWRLVANIGESEISKSLDNGGRVALVYANGEAQLFKEAGFSANGMAEGALGSRAKIGEGDGWSAIKYIKVYSKALTLDELLEDGAIPDTWIDFSDITVIKDNSYYFLATGGDFGDEPNSYYKSLKGLFTSEREPHPEAYEIKTILESSIKEPFKVSGMFGDVPMMASSEMGSGKAYIKSKGGEAVISYNGAIESFKVGGKEKLTSPLLPTTVRDETVSEYERGVYFDEVNFTTKTFELIEGGVRVELIARSGAVLNIEYTMTEDDVLHASVQAHFPQSVSRPSFIGFTGSGDYDKAAWTGFGFDSSYPDRRRAGKYGEFEAEIKDLSDNYHLWGENGNRDAFVFTVSKGDNALTFSSPQGLECRALPEDNGASLRVGGYIAGLSEIEKYKLNNSYYGFSFELSDKGQMADILSGANFIYIDGARFTDFAPGVHEYVYRTDGTPKVEVVGMSEVKYFDDRCEIENGRYTIYFAPKDIYLSDIAEITSSGEIAKDKNLTGGDIRLSGEMFSGESDKPYEKGISMKAGSSITYDVSEFDHHTLSLVIGKNSADIFGGGWFNRGMFDAEAKVSVYLDGVLSEEIGGISMRSGRREISVDVSGAKELVIKVEGTGREDTAAFEDAVLADAKIVPKGPIVLNAQKTDDKATITLLNTDSDALDVVLSSTDGEKVTTVGARIAKGAYRTLTLDNVSDTAKVQAVFKNNKIEIE